MDVVGPLQPSAGYTHLLTIVDRATRWPELIPLRETTSVECARALIGAWISRLGIPIDIISDRGLQFTSALWSTITQQLAVQVHRTTAYHPQANGMVDRFHRTLKSALKARLSGDNWIDEIELVGNKISKVTGILYRLKNVFPENVLFVLYNSLIVSYINYRLLLWGIHSHKLELLQKKALRLMTDSNYLAHTTPLLIKHGLLNVRDMYKLKLLKFYYKLSYDLLPPYFNKYIEIIEQKPARDLRFQYIHAPLVKLYMRNVALFSKLFI